MTKRRSVIPKTMKTMHEQFHFAPAVRVGKTLYCSGQTGFNEEGKLDPDPAVQIGQAFENVRTVLKKAGGTLADIVENYDEIDKALRGTEFEKFLPQPADKTRCV